MVRVVLWAQETFNGQKYDTYEADVSTDKLLKTDLTELVSGLSSAFEGLLAPYKDQIPVDTTKKMLASAWALILQTLGVSDADDLTSDEAFGIGVEPEVPAATLATTVVPPEGTIPPEEEGGVATETSDPFVQFKRLVEVHLKRK
jgi:hypothetical protein